MREHLLAGARLAGNQHRLGGDGNRFEVLEERSHLAAVGDDAGKGVVVLQAVRKQVAFQHAHLPPQRVHLERMANARHQAAFLDRLDEVVERTLLHAAHGGLDIERGGHHDHRHFRVEVNDVRQQFVAGDMRHEEVEQHARPPAAARVPAAVPGCR
jgi:hypothetical protein